MGDIMLIICIKRRSQASRTGEEVNRSATIRTAGSPAHRWEDQGTASSAKIQCTKASTNPRHRRLVPWQVRKSREAGEKDGAQQTPADQEIAIASNQKEMGQQRQVIVFQYVISPFQIIFTHNRSFL